MFHLRILTLAIFLAACSPTPTDIHDSRFIMGTLVGFTVAGSDRGIAATAISAAAAEMQRIEDNFTIYGSYDNSVKQFNRAPIGAPVQLSDEVERLLEVSLDIQQKSGGAFNPLIGKLNLLWGFSQLEKLSLLPPSRQAVEEALPPPHCVEKRATSWIRLDARCMLDFGAIAKGYAIDRGIEVLKQYGIKNAIINAGGDIRLIGRHGDRPWRIGIRHPRDKSEVIAPLELEGDVAVVTSGDYERFYIHEGIRYHHILNPETGTPAAKAQSATVITHGNAMLADAWSTALFVAGHPEDIGGLPYLLVTTDGSSIFSSNLPQKD